MTLTDDKITRMPIRDLLGYLIEGTLTPDVVLAAHLSRIARLEPSIRAWSFIDEKVASDSCHQTVCRDERGPLFGLPFGVKDIFETANMPTEFGSKIYSDNRPRSDASAVSILKSAGSICIGKTVTTEFAAVKPSVTRNPHRLSHTPGGSSSGSAAAVASYMVPFALGTQTMGSLIRPAAYCGVVGYKPSYSLVSKAGIKAQAPSMDHVGLIARSVDDAAIVAEVLTGFDTGSFSSKLQLKPSIGIFIQPEWEKAEACALEALLETSRFFAAAGARLETIVATQPILDAFYAQPTVLAYEMARSLAWEFSAHPALISEELKRWISQGFSITPDHYLEELKKVEIGRSEISAYFDNYDCFLTLSAPGEAPYGLDNTGDTVFNRLWSALHLPAITIPVCLGSKGLPLGIQIIGRNNSDRNLFAIANWAETILQKRNILS